MHERVAATRCSKIIAATIESRQKSTNEKTTNPVAATAYDLCRQMEKSRQKASD